METFVENMIREHHFKRIASDALVKRWNAVVLQRLLDPT